MRTRVKICGITRREDALAAAELGVDAIGFVFYASSPRHIDKVGARDICRSLPPFITKVGLFVNAIAEQVHETREFVGLDLLQFHGDEDPEYCHGFDQPYLKVVRMQTDTDLAEVASRFPRASALLLDSFIDGQAGGTGKTFDWAKVPAGLPMPVVLAGGLTADNVASAIKQVRPYAVDVSSGVEHAGGIKDASKMAAFMRAVRDNV